MVLIDGGLFSDRVRSITIGGFDIDKYNTEARTNNLRSELGLDELVGEGCLEGEMPL